MTLPRRPFGLVLGVAVGLSLAPAARSQDDPRSAARTEAGEMDQHEEKAVQKALERAKKEGDTDRGRWLQEMAKAFPDRAGPARTEADFDQWFTLLAAGGREWRRADAPTRGLAEMFDRLTQALDLGPVPSVRRGEFRQYARQALLPKGRAGKPDDPFADADRTFRVLDRDGSGVLEPEEWTEQLKAARDADRDGNGRISRDEYRAYFQARVTTALELVRAAEAARTAAAAGAPLPPVRPGKRPSALPKWFEQLDTDGDGQIGLYEWRMAGLPTDRFKEMDLDGDGLLTVAEYLRYVKLHPEGVPAELVPAKPVKK
jgi:hypothetical protein